MHFDGTISEFAQRLNTDKTIVYGLVRYLESVGHIEKIGVRPVVKTATNPKGVGKAADIYRFPESVTLAFVQSKI